jgi:hypothetical protein
MAASISAGRLSRQDDTTTVMAAGVLAVVAIAMLVMQQVVRRVEATLSAGVLRVLHIRSAESLGVSVVFPLRGHFVGYTLSVGCSAALLIIPFVLVSAGLLGTGRVPLRRCLQSLGMVTVILIVVNQMRFLVIAASMVLWGFRVGYERSHVFFGTLLSTVGVVAGVIVFIFMLGGEGRRAHSVESADDEF